MPAHSLSSGIIRGVAFAGAAVLVAMTTACGTASVGAESPSPTPSQSSVGAGEVLPVGCSDDAPCSFSAGSYTLGSGTVLPGLRLTLPAGWSSSENDAGELNLIFKSEPNDRVFVWTDMTPVKSSGPGHGVTVIDGVGQSADSLLAWVDHNPDFEVTAADPRAIAGITMQARIVGVSSSANYGDPDCPANPRCADLFTRVGFWGSNSYGIGG